MTVVSRQVIALMITSLILPVLFAPAYASEEDWQTHYAVNGFVNVGLPDPYQIFKVHYRAINGTVDEFRMPYEGYAHYMQANVTSDGNGLLEIKFPKNYPSGDIDGGGDAIFFIDTQETIAEDSHANDCFRQFRIPFTGDVVIDVVWTSAMTDEPFRGVEVSESCIPETIVQDVMRTKDDVITPYHQMKAGVKLDEVVCELVTHASGKTYCATPNSAWVLKERWM